MPPGMQQCSFLSISELSLYSSAPRTLQTLPAITTALTSAGSSPSSAKSLMFVCVEGVLRTGLSPVTWTTIPVTGGVT